MNIDQNDSNQAVLEDAEKKSNAPESDVIAESSAKNVSKRGRKEMEVDDTIANRGKNEPRSENNSTTKRSKKSVEGNIAIKRLSKVMEKKDHVNKTAAKPGKNLCLCTFSPYFHLILQLRILLPYI